MEADLKRTVEALLFASPVSLSLSRLQNIIPHSDKRSLRAAIEELCADYKAAGHAFQLKEIAGGWRVLTHPEHTRIIEEMLKGQRRVRLSKAALEVLAVVTYRQPCTRVDVESVRGVNCGGPLATLLERGMVRITGRAETLGRPLLYSTTNELLAHLGINRLEDLPQLTEIEALLTPSGNGNGSDSAIVHEERRERLLDGMESIADIMGAAEQENVNCEEPIALNADNGGSGVDEDGGNTGEDDAKLGEHAWLLTEGLALERDALSTGASALPESSSADPDHCDEPRAESAAETAEEVET